MFRVTRRLTCNVVKDRGAPTPRSKRKRGVYYLMIDTECSAVAKQYLNIKCKDDDKSLAQGYLPDGSPRKYCDPCTVSLPSSRWIGVVPVQQVHQEIATSCFA